jgi:hypothetical protein
LAYADGKAEFISETLKEAVERTTFMPGDHLEELPR